MAAVEAVDEQIDKEDTNVMSAVKLLSALKNISAIVTKGRNLTIGPELYGLQSYKINQLECSSFTEMEPFFSVFNVGDELNSYVALKPSFTGNFSNLDGYLLYMVELFEKIKNKSCRLFIEPTRDKWNGGEIYSPKSLGIPMDSLSNSSCNIENIINVLFPLCTPLVGGLRDIYHTRVNVLCNEREALLMNQYRNLIDGTTENLRQMFLTHWRYVLEGEVPPKCPQIVGERVKLMPIADPSRLNLFFDGIPFPMLMSYAMVCELLFPKEITLNPVSHSDLQKCSGVSAVKANVISSFGVLSLNSSEDEAVYAYVSSFIFPGYIRFNVDLTIINRDDPLCITDLLICKLMFYYSEIDDRWSNISMDSVELIDIRILLILYDLNIIQYELAIPHGGEIEWEFENFRPQRLYATMIPDFQDLGTRNDGSGWMNSGNNVFGGIDNGAAQYPHCALRQLFVNVVDTRVRKRDDRFEQRIIQWRTMRAVLQVAAALVKCNQKFGGIDTVLRMCGKQFFSFITEINIYNRNNWYTGVRITQNVYRNLNQQDTDLNSKVLNIKLNSVASMFRSLNGDAPLERKYGYDVQFKMESSMVFDILESASKFQMFNMIIARSQLNGNEYKVSELMDLAMNKDNPIYKHFIVCKKLGEARNFTLGNWFEGEQLYIFFRGIVDYIIAGDIEFGYIRHFYKRDLIMNMGADFY